MRSKVDGWTDRQKYRSDVSNTTELHSDIKRNGIPILASMWMGLENGSRSHCPQIQMLLLGHLGLDIPYLLMQNTSVF